MMSLLFFNLRWINEWNVMKGWARHLIMVFSKASKLCHWFLGPKLEDDDFCFTKNHRGIWTHSTLHKNFYRNVKCWGNLEWRLGFCFNSLWLKGITFRIYLVGKRSINLHFSPFPCDLFSWSLPDHKITVRCDQTRIYEAFFGCFTSREEKIPSLELGLLRNLEKKTWLIWAWNFYKFHEQHGSKKKTGGKYTAPKTFFEVVEDWGFPPNFKGDDVGNEQIPNTTVSSLRKIVIHPLWLSSNQKIHQKCGTLLIMSCFQKWDALFEAIFATWWLVWENVNSLDKLPALAD